MTECDRIIKEGILPASFFEEETICDFLVTTERKKIWAISLDMLIQVDRICRKYGLKYFMAFGSLLGIIRHNGFIPWDDDLDICMPREDYEQFIVIAQKELSPPYFLQIPGKDNDYFFSYTKIRNSNTTCISFPFRYCEFNQGIGMDIFVLDNCHLHIVEENFVKVKQLVLENSANMRRSNPHPSPADVERIQQFEGRNPYEVLAELNDIYKRANKENSDYCMPSGLCVYSPQKLIYKYDNVLDLIDTDFYGYKFLAPKDAESVLTITYGDFMIFPEIEERGKWHNAEFFNPDKPYKEFLIELKEKENDANA